MKAVLRRVVFNIVGFLLLYLIASAVPIQLRMITFFQGGMMMVLGQVQMSMVSVLISPLPSRARSLGLRLYVLFCILSCTAPLVAKLVPGVLLTEISLAFMVSNMWLVFLSILTIPFRSLLSPARRAVLIWILCALFCGASTYEARLEPSVRHIHHRMGLSRPLTITHVSDLHLGPVLREDFCNHVLKTVTSLKSDLLLISGDLFDAPPSAIPDIVSNCISAMPAPHGIYVVSGNHEYITGAWPQWMSVLRNGGIHVLENSCSRVDDRVDIVGVNDLSAARMAQADTSIQPADVQQAVTSCRDTSVPRIIMAHQPNHIQEISQHSPNVPTLVLSGHTHKGQFFPVNIIVWLVNSYFAGFYQHNDWTHIFVHSGTGQWGPRFRLFARSEIVKIHLS